MRAAHKRDISVYGMIDTPYFLLPKASAQS